MEFLYLNFYTCLRLRFQDVKTNIGPQRPVPTVCRLSSVVMCRALPGTLVTWPWRYLGMTYCCALRLWSQICVMCRSCWFLNLVTLSYCAGAGRPRARGMAAYAKDGYRAFRQPKFDCGCFEKMVFRACGARQNLYMFNLYRNPDLDDWIFNCLLT